jgi:hypothetical protein
VKTIAKPSLAPPWISQTPRPDSQRQDRAVQACAGRAVRPIDPSRQRAGNGARVRAKHELPTARLIDRRDLTPDLMVIRLEPEARYTFAPGQYCTIGLEGIERPYSIVSSPHEPTLELFVELVPHGTLTPRLWRLRLGDSLSLRARPKGVFTLQERFPSHLI